MCGDVLVIYRVPAAGAFLQSAGERFTLPSSSLDVASNVVVNPQGSLVAVRTGPAISVFRVPSELVIGNFHIVSGAPVQMVWSGQGSLAIQFEQQIALWRPTEPGATIRRFTVSLPSVMRLVWGPNGSGVLFKSLCTTRSVVGASKASRRIGRTAKTAPPRPYGANSPVLPSDLGCPRATA